MMTLTAEIFAAICAVENLELSPEAKARTVDFNSRGLSNDDRRREILRAYRNEGSK